MIDIDTIKLLELSMNLKRTNNQIDEAVAMLQSIHTHNDWGCPERRVINEYIMESRGYAIRMQDNCSRFVEATRAVADEFVETEKGIANLFDSVEDAIRGIIAMPVVKTIFNGVASPAVRISMPTHSNPLNQLGTIGMISRNDIKMNGRHG